MGCKESSDHHVRVPVFLRKNVSFGFSAQQKMDKNVLNLESEHKAFQICQVLPVIIKLTLASEWGGGGGEVCVRLHLTAQCLEA